MKMKGFFKILSGLFLIILGAIIGMIIYHYYTLPSVETINLIDLATLVTTIFLAVYIPEVLDRKLQIKRDKKELIEDRIGELQALYRKINLLVQQDNITEKDRIAIRNTLDISQHKFKIVETLLNFSGMKTSFSKEIAGINRLIREHKELLWNDDDHYTAETRDKEEALYNSMDRETCLLVFKISDA